MGFAPYPESGHIPPTSFHPVFLSHLSLILYRTLAIPYISSISGDDYKRNRLTFPSSYSILRSNKI